MSLTTVQVWVAPLDPPAATLDSLVAALSPCERDRAARLRSPDDARRYGAAHGWLRHVLGAELGIGPEEIDLSTGPGKPRLAGAQGPCFNLSHAWELALIAMADQAVGVDVEHGDNGRGWQEAADLACTPSEAAALHQLPAGERASLFLRMWTAKEAYLKAIGAGLSLPPDHVEIGPARPDGTRVVRVISDSGRVSWRVRELRPAPGYVGAVAAEGDNWGVRLCRTDDLRVGAVGTMRQ